MVPDCIKLQQRQLDKLDRFHKHIQKVIDEETILDALEESAVVTSPFTFKIYSTGLGDCIIVTGFNKKCNLTIDDDNELCVDEWEEL